MLAKLKIAMCGCCKLIDKTLSWNAILFWRELWPCNDLVVPFHDARKAGYEYLNGKMRSPDVLDSGQEQTFKYGALDKAKSLLSWLSEEIPKMEIQRTKMDASRAKHEHLTVTVDRHTTVYLAERSRQRHQSSSMGSQMRLQRLYGAQELLLELALVTVILGMAFAVCALRLHVSS